MWYILFLLFASVHAQGNITQCLQELNTCTANNIDLLQQLFSMSNNNTLLQQDVNNITSILLHTRAEFNFTLIVAQRMQEDNVELRRDLSNAQVSLQIAYDDNLSLNNGIAIRNGVVIFLSIVCLVQGVVLILVYKLYKQRRSLEAGVSMAPSLLPPRE